ncbi:MAG TPA: AlpA family phage regulatory protein [Bradyrhizobium sp.]|nr:AlpA family phage regulatory protein [Bradyrhizobium sp.]
MHGDGWQLCTAAGWLELQENPWAASHLLFSMVVARHKRSVVIMSSRLISYDQLKPKGIMYSKPHLWRLEKAGKFPKRVPVGPGRYAYVETEIDTHVDNLIAARSSDVKAA